MTYSESRGFSPSTLVASPTRNVVRVGWDSPLTGPSIVAVLHDQTWVISGCKTRPYRKPSTGSGWPASFVIQFSSHITLNLTHWLSNSIFKALAVPTNYNILTSFFRDSKSKFFSSFKLLLMRSRLRFSIIGFEDYRSKKFRPFKLIYTVRYSHLYVQFWPKTLVRVRKILWYKTK